MTYRPSYDFDENDFFDDDFGAYGSINGYPTEDDYDDDLSDILLQRQMDEDTVEKVFHKIPDHGYNARAYKPKIDNLKILKLYREGHSVREIASICGYSRSTVFYRLKQIKEYENRINNSRPN